MSENMKRVGFVILCFGIGFCIEYFLHRKDDKIVVNHDNRRILFLGGSIVNSIGEGVKSILDEKNEGYQTVIMSDARMHSSETVNYLKGIVPVLRPEAVFLLVGMNENSKVQKTEMGLDLDKRIRFMTLAMQKEKVKLNQEVLSTLKEMQPGLITHLYLYFMMNKFQFADLINWRPLLEKGQSIVMDSILSGKITQDEFNSYYGMHLLLSRAHMQQDVPKQSFSLGLHLQGAIIANIERQIRFGLTQISKFGCGQLKKPERLYGVLEHQWLCGIVKQSKADEKSVISYIEKNPILLTCYSSFLPAFDIPKLSKMKGMNPTLVAAFGKSKEFSWIYFPKLETSNPDEAFIHELAKVKDYLDSEKVQLILLQYPNAEKDYIVRAAKALDVKAVNGRLAFNNVLTKENYDQIFIDVIEDTGHLTAYGGTLYGRSLVEQLPEIFNQK